MINRAFKWLLRKVVPFQTLLEAGIEEAVARVNKNMASEGAARTVRKIASAGKTVAHYGAEVCDMLDDAKIDDKEKQKIKDRVVPFCLTQITKALQ